MISIILPANNEEEYIGTCLQSILASDDPGGPVEVIVVANGCIDDTVEVARACSLAFERRGWVLEVLCLLEGGKIGALNAGDAAARYGKRIFLDADVYITEGVLKGLAKALDVDAPAYASGRLKFTKAKGFVSERYARFWKHLPFMAEGVPGCGLYAINAAGRARWGTFPDIISDDTFVRCQFSDEEQRRTEASYYWPVTEGFANLVRVRRRQDTGLREIRQLYPDLAARVASTAPSIGRKLRLFFRDPIGFTIYTAVAILVLLPVFRSDNRWYRGR